MIHAYRLLLIGGLLLSPIAARAETHATCAGFIDSVPAVINTQGTWCLRHDLSTAITAGSAIEVVTNNVTIDCNGFKLGGLAAGTSSTTRGINAIDRQNLTVRNCNVRGFFTGIYMSGGAGHLLEDNRIDNSLVWGIYLIAENSIVRRNRVLDTGGFPSNGGSTGIVATSDIVDNVVAGVFGTSEDASPEGIAHYSSSGSTIQGNRVSGVLPSGSGTARGLAVFGSNVRIQGNHVTANVPTPGIGVYAPGLASFCLDNTSSNFTTALMQCEQSVGNLALPAP